VYSTRQLPVVHAIGPEPAIYRNPATGLPAYTIIRSTQNGLYYAQGSNGTLIAGPFNSANPTGAQLLASYHQLLSAQAIPAGSLVPTGSPSAIAVMAPGPQDGSAIPPAMAPPAGAGPITIAGIPIGWIVAGGILLFVFTKGRR
jgi:hypothetical protein